MGKLSEIEFLRLSLPDQIARRIRHSIVTGALPPGTHLREIELANGLQVSRGPVREALRILQSEGLLEAFPGRGVFVARFQDKDMAELFDLRHVLEMHAVHLAMARMTTERLAELDAVVSEARRVARTGDVDRVFELELELHTRLWRLSDNERLVRLLTEILSQIRAFLGISRELYVDLFDGVADHEQLLEALQSGEVEKAEAEMSAHLARTHRILSAHFQKLNGSLATIAEGG